MNSVDLRNLIKICIELPRDAHVESEGLWAKPLGMSLYEVRNTPLLAYDLHWGDVVSCQGEESADRPRILQVVHRSGHKTLRVLFNEECPETAWTKTLSELAVLGASHCQGWQRFYAIDVPPTVDYEAICYFLWEQEQADVLQYETGMTRPYNEMCVA